LRTLRASGNVVGFLGDGIKDAPAAQRGYRDLRGWRSKHLPRSGRLILLGEELHVLEEGECGGRRNFATCSDSKMERQFETSATSVFSDRWRSAALPFLPLMPLQAAGEESALRFLEVA